MSISQLRVNVFPGGFNWPIFVGQEKGFFREHNLDITVQATPNSISQMTDFAEGRFEIAMTAVDNIVAYVEGQGEAPIGAQPEFFAFMGVDSGFLSLVTSPDIASIADLRGRSLCVDAMTTGYAFVLYEILRRAGFVKDKDYEVASAGGMIQRWTALKEGRYAATLLSAPYNLIAQQFGFRDHGRAVDLIGPYQGNVGAARRSWAVAHPELIAAYRAAFLKATRWLYEPAHQSEAVEILQRHVPNLPPAVAAQSYGALLDSRYGFSRDGLIAPQAIRCVLDLRNRFRPAAKTLTDIARYCG